MLCVGYSIGCTVSYVTFQKIRNFVNLNFIRITAYKKARQFYLPDSSSLHMKFKYVSIFRFPRPIAPPSAPPSCTATCILRDKH